MQQMNTSWDVSACIDAWKRDYEKVGFVATMGNLHDGHLRLIDAVREVSDRTVVSIYVNPLQFGQNEDLADYPRTLEADLAKLQQRQVNMVFTPDDQMMYPEGRDEATKIRVPTWLATQLEGAFRPGHFDGVATVVAKLFHIIRPDIAAFGEKDFQQLRVIERMVHDLNLPVEILPVATVRERDGLAISSRNQYLDTAQRKLAPALYEVLVETRQRVLLANMDFTDLEQSAIMALEKKGLAPDYVNIRHAISLREPEAPTDPLVILAAARLGHARLIDNLRV